MLRSAVEHGGNHIDTAAFSSSPLRSADEPINRALAPCPDGLVIVAKVGPEREPSGAWLPMAGPGQLRGQVEENPRQLGRDRLDVVNLRRTGRRSLAEHFGALAELREAGLVRHLGPSSVTPGHLAEAQAIAPVVRVQNSYSLDRRIADANGLVDGCRRQGIGPRAVLRDLGPATRSARRRHPRRPAPRGRARTRRDARTGPDGLDGCTAGRTYWRSPARPTPAT